MGLARPKSRRLRLLLTEDLERLARCLHPDPHSLLGPHRDDRGPLVRILRPFADEVRVIRGKASVAATRVHADGVFVARLDGSARDYRIEWRGPDGAIRSALDPYAFEPSIGELDIHLFSEGKHHALFRRLGSQVVEHQGVRGTSFTVWAPAALAMRVVGDFNDWAPELGAMRRLSGDIWEIFVPGVGAGALYKYQVGTRRGPLDKSDPLGRSMEVRPQTASRVVESSYAWRDDAWALRRADIQRPNAPISIYEVHLPSWRRHPETVPPKEGEEPDESARWLSYRELAVELVGYVKDLGFTHIELLPVLEHPYDGSWGYQVSGYFAPTSRLGTPDDFRFFVDACHAAGIGVLLDWVPAHFPRDAAALGRFDGTPLYEHWDPRRGEHRQWETFVFDWGRPQVKNFLIASALYWLEEFHLDGLRVDAVASMLYLDYGANAPDEWEPNVHGGRENLEAIALLKRTNEVIGVECPGAFTVAEESTAFPRVSAPTYDGGLGFHFKWNMGWMHDTLKYMAQDPVHRRWHHDKMSFGLVYAFTENFVLPLSHDEVVHGKGSLFGRMPGDEWQQFANLRAYYGFMWAHPGKKLLFMGQEFAQRTEWNHDVELPWGLLGDARHAGVQRLVRDLNQLYRSETALHQHDHDPAGFEWIAVGEAETSVYAWLRRDAAGRTALVVCNFTPVPRHGYRLGVPPGTAQWREALNTDSAWYGGSNVGNGMMSLRTEGIGAHGRAQSVELVLPPLATVILLPQE
jgi:1,4-alpha-glucan branching enzyme